MEDQPEENNEPDDLFSRAQGEGGFAYCNACGYNATLTEEQFLLLAAGHETWCEDCEKAGIDAILGVGRDLPDWIAPDEPMKAHSQKKPISRLV